MKTILIEGKKWSYSGELDNKGKACGVGKAVRGLKSHLGNIEQSYYSGTFFND